MTIVALMASAYAGTAAIGRPLTGFELLDIRGGIQGFEAGANPTFCVELDAPKWIGFDGCGTIQGLLQPGQDGQEMAHFRLEGTIPLHSWDRISLDLQPSVGFAEVQNGIDEPGFNFGAAKSPTQRDGAGPESALSIKARMWPHERFYMTGEISGGAAIIPSAPTVFGRGGSVVPYTLGTVGVGF